VKSITLIGYSGHAFVVCDIFASQNLAIEGYCEKEEKKFNPYNLPFLGRENSVLSLETIKRNNYFVAVGDNRIRKKIIENLQNKLQKFPINAIHKKASVSETASLGYGVMIGNSSIINPCVSIGNGVICNTLSVVEHECEIGAYSHIAPGAILCGNVKVGVNTFIGANSVIREGIKIGDGVIIGAGTVVIRDIPNNSKVVGNPQKHI